MKKILICLFTLLLLTGCQKETIEYNQPTGTIADMSGYGGLQSEQFYEIDVFDAYKLFGAEGSTTILYIGYDSCPWCNCLVPVLDEVSKEKDMKVYYLDFKSDINYYNPEQLWRIVDLVGEAGYLETDEEGEFAIAMPCVIYIQKGQIINFHQGTVSGHDASSQTMSEKQTARLKYMLEKEFDSIYDVKKDK